jgi:hypothetical protein
MLNDEIALAERCATLSFNTSDPVSPDQAQSRPLMLWLAAGS